MMTKTSCLVLLLTASSALASPKDLAKQNQHEDQMSCLGPRPDKQVGDEVKAAVKDGERAFAVNVLKDVFKQFKAEADGQERISRNIFLSPHSIYQALTLAYMGSDGVTEEELQSVMGIKDLDRWDVAKNYLFEREFSAIRSRESPESLGYTMDVANKLYFDRSLSLDQCLQLVLSRGQENQMEALDFGQAEKSRKLINRWVEERTRKKVKDLLPEGALGGDSKVALVNAAYFKGEWAAKFNVSETRLDNFYVRRDKFSKVKFMTRKGEYNYYPSEELRAHVLEMPYVGEDVSLMLILPPFEDSALFETVARLTPKTLRGVMAEVKSGFFRVEDLTVKVPRFRVEQSLKLNPTLTRLGLSSLFDASASDLSRFLAPEEDATVSLQSALHKSFIDVNEEGSEAAAATAIFGFRSARPLFHKEFKADHPFLFLVYDKPTDTILFFGVYQDPKF